MTDIAEIRTTDSAYSPHPLSDVIAVASRPESAALAEEDELMLTLGETRWSVNAGIRLRLADPVRQEANRCRLLEALSRPGPLWDPAQHPESEGEGGSAAWVRRLRGESELAFERRTRVKDDNDHPARHLRHH